ncbi:hypothetical protein [Blastococcus sp. SYSU D01042]
MDDPFPPLERHAAADRAGKNALRTAHAITQALAADGAGAEDPVLLRRGGRHRSIDGLMSLIDEALSDEAPGKAPDEEPPDR